MADLPQLLRLSKVAKEFNIGLQTIVDFLSRKGHQIESNPNTKLTSEMYYLLVKEFQSEKSVKEESCRLELTFTRKEAVLDDVVKPIENEEKEIEEHLFIKDNKPVAVDKKEIFKIDVSDIEIKNPKIVGKLEEKKSTQKIKKPAKKVQKTE